MGLILHERFNTRTVNRHIVVTGKHGDEVTYDADQLAARYAGIVASHGILTHRQLLRVLMATHEDCARPAPQYTSKGGK